MGKLQEILKLGGMTQEAVARRLGVSYPTVNSWVNGRSLPRKQALSAIDVLYAEVVGGKGIDADELAALIATAESHRLTADDIAGDRQLLDDLTLTLTYHTDAIEGSTMTIADTEAVLFGGTALSNRTLVEQLEAKNHQAALWWLVEEIRRPGFRVNDELIGNVHTRLMNGIMSDAGEYRRHPVRIAHARVAPANYVRVPELVAKLCSVKQQKNQSSVAFLAHHHARFEWIHPFSDGNGRVGRLLLLALALRRGIVPPIIERERRAFYYTALEAAQVSEDHALLQQLLAESIIVASRNGLARNG